MENTIGVRIWRRRPLSSVAAVASKQWFVQTGERRELIYPAAAHTAHSRDSPSCSSVKRCTIQPAAHMLASVSQV